MVPGEAVKGGDSSTITLPIATVALLLVTAGCRVFQVTVLRGPGLKGLADAMLPKAPYSMGESEWVCTNQKLVDASLGLLLDQIDTVFPAAPLLPGPHSIPKPKFCSQQTLHPLTRQHVFDRKRNDGVNFGERDTHD